MEMTKDDLCRLEQPELVKLIEEDRLTYQPCKVGNTIWCLFEDFNTFEFEIYHATFLTSYTDRENNEVWVLDVCFSNDYYLIVDVEKERVFLTREEAEAKLKEMES